MSTDSIFSRQLSSRRLQHSEVYSRPRKWLLKKRLKKRHDLGALTDSPSMEGPLKPTGVLSVGSPGKWTLRVHRTRKGTTRYHDEIRVADPRGRKTDFVPSPERERRRERQRADTAPGSRVSLLIHARVQCTHGCTMRVTHDESLWILKIEIYLRPVRARISIGRSISRQTYPFNMKRSFSLSLFTTIIYKIITKFCNNLQKLLNIKNY